MRAPTTTSRVAKTSLLLTKWRKIRRGYCAHNTKLSAYVKVLLSQDEPDIL